MAYFIVVIYRSNDILFILIETFFIIHCQNYGSNTDRMASSILSIYSNINGDLLSITLTEYQLPAHGYHFKDYLNIMSSMKITKN